jgi:hypothetical protein
MPPDIARMTFKEAEAELDRLAHEHKKCILDAVQAKTIGDFEQAKLLNRRAQALIARRCLVARQKHETTPEIRAKGVFKRAVYETVDQATWEKILARRDELVAQAIEARRATTPQSGVVEDESAVANGDAPEQGQPSGTSTENGDG